MTKHTTHVRSWPAVGLAALCVAGTFYVLFEDVVRGGEVNVGHVTGVIALVVTIAAGHMLWPLLRVRPVSAFGLALLFAAGTGYVVITSAGRTAHVMADKQLVAAEANKRYVAAKTKAERLAGAHEAAKQAAAAECGGGKGKRCEGRAMTAAYAKIEADEAAAAAATLRPRVEASDYRQAAELIATIAGGDRRTYEAQLSLVVPFLLALLCEIGAIVFGNVALEHRHVEVEAKRLPAPVLKAETIPEAPKVLTAEMVSKLKAEGKKHSEIASMFGVNQGRVSELLNGQRNLVVLN